MTELDFINELIDVLEQDVEQTYRSLEWLRSMETEANEDEMYAIVEQGTTIKDHLEQMEKRIKAAKNIKKMLTN